MFLLDLVIRLREGRVWLRSANLEIELSNLERELVHVTNPGHYVRFMESSLKIGQRMKVVFKPTDGAPLPFFTPAG